LTLSLLDGGVGGVGVPDLQVPPYKVVPSGQTHLCSSSFLMNGDIQSSTQFPS